MKTICVNCGAVLTNEKGQRILSGNFDARLPAIKPTKDTTYARCDSCHASAIAIRLYRDGKQ